MNKLLVISTGEQPAAVPVAENLDTHGQIAKQICEANIIRMNTVYKYCDHYGVDILRNLELKITPPNQFNDPFEFTPHCVCSDRQGKVMSLITPEDIEFLKDAFETERENGRFTGTFEEFRKVADAHASQAIPATMQQLQIQYLDNISHHSGVLCLSERRNSIIMWGHYGDRHRGLVIGLDGSNAIFQKGVGLRPVDYVKERVVFDTCWKEGAEENKYRDALVFSKNEEWKYEGELRQIFTLDGGLTKRPVPDQRTGEEFLYFHPLPPEAILSVSLGVRCPPELQKQIELALKNPRLAHVSLDQAGMDESKFELTFKEVDVARAVRPEENGC
jgi:hypothetical protein